ncbi:hypothetical protein Skr01_19790 [Sphaerisporangium krabiense]|uniref:Preprotein translocase subunit SecB n=1 Tax=Sphaerisporangium krabiense TaxID=763782 RepID=A0A7W8Z5B5_9ACTN|nr:hypothetical protein [Sphaerisporangium krabiense]MBB5627736.1 hypothetical protein [Sphaerisporangium krabiense]GII61894.1 hypothetical protein Skr01_19790 [Sphaerisporangium krabiense]
MTTGKEPPGAVDALVERISDRVELQDITPVAFSAERLKPGDGVELKMALASAAATADGSLSYKFDLTGRVLDGDDESIVTFSVSMVVTYVPRDPDHEALTEDTSALKVFGEQVAWVEVYPYLREAVQAVLGRLRIHAFQLPMLRPASGLEADVTG